MQPDKSRTMPVDSETSSIAFEALSFISLLRDKMGFRLAIGVHEVPRDIFNFIWDYEEGDSEGHPLANDPASPMWWKRIAEFITVYTAEPPTPHEAAKAKPATEEPEQKEEDPKGEPEKERPEGPPLSATGKPMRELTGFHREKFDAVRACPGCSTKMSEPRKYLEGSDGSINWDCPKCSANVSRKFKEVHTTWRTPLTRDHNR